VTAMRATDEYVSSFSKRSIERCSHRLVHFSEKREIVPLYYNLCSIHHEGIWERGGISSLILNLDTRLGEQSGSRPDSFSPGARSRSIE
jgi:hypothetical protein